MARTKAQAIRSVNGEVGQKKVRRFKRWRPGTKAKREIKKLQTSTRTLVPKSSMERLIREISQEFATDVRFKPSAIEALQQAAEMYVTGVFKKSDVVRAHCKRETLAIEDMRTAIRVQDP